MSQKEIIKRFKELKKNGKIPQNAVIIWHYDGHRRVTPQIYIPESKKEELLK